MEATADLGPVVTDDQIPVLYGRRQPALRAVGDRQTNPLTAANWAFCLAVAIRRAARILCAS